MFFRVLLLSYFALGAAWGPAFCCCRVRSLVDYCTHSLVATVSAKSALAVENSPRCPRCRQLDREAAVSQPAELAEANCCHVSSKPIPADSECPCQQRGESKFGIAEASIPGLAKASNHNQQPSDFWGVALGLGFDSIAVPFPRSKLQNWLLERETLYGRALLRAYQTLNC